VLVNQEENMGTSEMKLNLYMLLICLYFVKT
jgi:hypothetical protein